jgi:hypothetical protein
MVRWISGTEEVFTIVCVSCEKEFNSHSGTDQKCADCMLAAINEANRRSGLPPLSMD